MKTRILFLSSLILVILAASACIPGFLVPTNDLRALGTQAMQTVAVKLTQSAFETLVAQLTLVAPATPTLSQPTKLVTYSTFTSTSTSTLRPSQTKVAPSLTMVLPSRTPIPPTATHTKIQYCDWAQFVKDISVPDGSDFTPKATFTKTWRLKNIGACAWTHDYALVFSSGNAMSGLAAIKLPVPVQPGETIDLSVDLTAPQDGGTYKGYWKLRNSKGEQFGIGSSAEDAFWVKIDVIAKTATPNPNLPLDFTYNYCAADWRSTTGALGCPGSGSDFNKGSISRLTGPKLEGGYQENETILLSIPSDGTGGLISGKYGAYKVQNNDHFRTVVGCLDANPKCNVMFQLNYSIDGGPIKNLGTWTQISDGKLETIDINLNSFVNQNVQFILVVLNNGDSEDDRAFWLQPRIVR